MTLLRTLGFTAIITLLATIVIAPFFMESALFISFILVSLAGFALAHFFSHGSPEEQVEMTSIIFLILATFDIILGMLTNIVRQIGNMMVALPENASTQLAHQMGTFIINFFGSRLIFAELIILFIGLFGPLVILSQLSKQKIPTRQVLLNVVAVVVLYIISTGIVMIINYRIGLAFALTL